MKEKKIPQHFKIHKDVLETLFCYAELKDLQGKHLLRDIITSGLDRVKDYESEVQATARYPRSTPRSLKCLSYDYETVEKINKATASLGCSKGFLAGFLITKFLDDALINLKIDDNKYVANDEKLNADIASLRHEYGGKGRF